MPKAILLVEDELPLLTTLRAALERGGFRVTGALDGETALASAKDEHPDLILLDLILPRLSGFDVLERLKQDPDTKDIPVVVLTHLEDPQDMERARELGAHSYLVKARYNLDDILERVQEVLGKPDS